MFQIPRFISSRENPEEASIIVAGIPYDCTSSFRSASRFGPRELRSYAFEAIEEFSFYQGKTLDDVPFCDVGDLEVMVGNPANMVNTVMEEIRPFLEDGKRVISIGGEHLVTYPLFLAHKEFYPEFTMVHFDAHADLREGYAGDELSHASVMKLCLDKGLERLIQIGIRSGTKEEYQLRQTDHRIIPANTVTEAADALEEGEVIYISIDLDYFDPSFVPGTGTPEAGGGSFNDFMKFIKIINEKKCRIIGADIVELAPDLDGSKISVAFTAKVLRELLISSHLNS
ncbi:MAG TPA: agmatinase [bacterium]|nr:agmatinase [bacterium]